MALEIDDPVTRENTENLCRDLVIAMEGHVHELRRQLNRLSDMGPLPKSGEYLWSALDDFDGSIWRYRRFLRDEGKCPGESPVVTLNSR